LARYGAFAAAGESIVRFLKGAFIGFPGTAPVIEQVTTGTFRADNGTQTNFNTANGSLTLLLYRIDIDPTHRGPVEWTHPPALNAPQAIYTLALDLRYLITAWASSPEVQQLILGRALSAIAAHSTFGPGDLVDSQGAVDNIWAPGETFQLLPDEMGTEDLYQIWEAIGRPFELSVPYKVRVIRLQADALDGAGTVLERDLVYGTAVAEAAS